MITSCCSPPGFPPSVRTHASILSPKHWFKQFPTLESYAEAPEEEIAEAIKTCGLFRTKARDLKACAIMLLSEYDGKVPDNMEDLLELPGVGRKTANLILGDIFGKPAIVTDTHCIRLSNRLGFVKNEKDPVKVENALRKLIDPAESSDFCHRLVLFGREHCTARNPKCGKLPARCGLPLLSCHKIIYFKRKKTTQACLRRFFIQSGVTWLSQPFSSVASIKQVSLFSPRPSKAGRLFS